MALQGHRKQPKHAETTPWDLAGTFPQRRNFLADIAALLFDASDDKVICRIALDIAVI